MLLKFNFVTLHSMRLKNLYLAFVSVFALEIISSDVNGINLDGVLTQGEWNQSRWSQIIHESDNFAETSGLLDDADRRELLNEVKWALRSFEPRLSVLLCMLGESVVVVPKDIEDEGWKFNCENYDINIDNGLYFGDKNLYTENHNIYISGISNEEIENIKWEIKKI